MDATNGNDRNLGASPAAAWKTIAKVNSYLDFGPGDRVLLKRGEVWREQLIVSASGTPDAPLLFGAYGEGGRPVLKGSDPVTNWRYSGRAGCWRASLDASPSQVFFNGVRGVREDALTSLDRALEWHWSAGVLYVYAFDHPDGGYAATAIEASVRSATRISGLVYIKDCEYVTLENIGVSQSNSFGVYVKPWARGITVRGCDVGHSLDGGLVAAAAGDIAATQITVEDCSIHHNNGGYKEGAPGVATYHEGLTMENVDGFVIVRTRVYDNYMEGVNLKRGARNGLIEHCDLYSNDLINLYMEGASNIQVRYNRIYDCTYNAGIEFGLETNAYPNDTVHIHHNMFWGNSGAISFWAGNFTTQTRNITIDNNTFYNNEFGVRWKTSATDHFGGVNFIRNNLFWPSRISYNGIRDQTAGRQGIAQTEISYNMFQEGTGSDTMGMEAKAIQDPRFVGPSSLNFHLRRDSVCIDGGIHVGLTRDFDGNVVPQGRAPDVGADEYVFPGGAGSFEDEEEASGALAAYNRRKILLGLLSCLILACGMILRRRNGVRAHGEPRCVV